jgi:hypothetical protein
MTKKRDKEIATNLVHENQIGVQLYYRKLWRETSRGGEVVLIA